MKILITGAAGFIGFHLAQRMLQRGDEVIGVDCINDYYSVDLKYDRLALLGITRREIKPGVTLTSRKYPAFKFQLLDIADRDALLALMEAERPEIVMNLAAQAGVRYSIENPYSYIHSNVTGFVTLLECSRLTGVHHVVYASSSSVYGGNTKTPFEETDSVDSPVSVYAATKKCDELLANVYRHLYALPSTGLRYFTVYGPWGRPDMAPMLFSKAILAGKPIRVFNNGNLSRDFTYIDDIVEGTMRVIDSAAAGKELCPVYNIGCGHPMQLMDFIRTLEEALQSKAVMEMLPMQPGDVYTTYADTTALSHDTGYNPSTPLSEGISRFARWYRDYFHQ